MLKEKGLIYYSASDIVNFLDCEHLTTLDLINLETPLPQAEADEESILYQTKGFAHEKSYLDHLKRLVSSFIEISEAQYDMDKAVNATIEAMHSGIEVIYQAALKDGCFIGHADFLRKVPIPSALGDFSYEVIDTKLAHSAKAKYLVQICFYSRLVSRTQMCDPLMMHVVLGDRREESFRYAEYDRYYGSLEQWFLSVVRGQRSETYPEPCNRCDSCRWCNLCETRRISDDHLSRVANITRLQIKRLSEKGITTLEALAGLPDGKSTPKIATETMAKLRHQAALQLKKRKSGKDHFDLLPLDPEGKRGLARLPEPDEGDIFFDIEGDPLVEGGLEYLLGVHYFEGGKPCFKSYWAHSRDEERHAFEKFMDFVTAHLFKYPRAHIYHYAHYEPTALKKLMSLHGIREAEVDNLLRYGKLIDLYKVVREGMRISEPGYSIKNVERFYRDSRTGPVKEAGMSLVYYERWKETEDSGLLKAIEEYNREDLRSTHGLRQWLIGLRPPELSWANQPADSSVPVQKTLSDLNEVERRLVRYRESLVDPLPENRDDWTEQHHVTELVYHLLDFHRRADKPVWWAFFSRQEMTDEELIEDIESIGCMKRDSKRSDNTEGTTGPYVYVYPEQETKLKTGDSCVRTDTLDRIYDVEIDEDSRSVIIYRRGSNKPFPEKISIGPDGPIKTMAIREAIYRFADDIIGGGKKYQALKAILNQDIPRIKQLSAGCAIIDESQTALPQIIEAVANLDQSYIFIQGPPGSGKTYTGSHVIVDLLRRGYRIGVSSNSHKAINNLLAWVEKTAVQKGVKFKGVKKSVHGKPDSMFKGSYIRDVFNNRDIDVSNHQLVAGTAWLLSGNQMDGEFDYLFVDEAGQVALATLIAMGTCGKNIVLLGDQMQLGQPIQGVHPGRSGESTLEYLLNGMATIPPDKGIFLKTTWRMHQDVCKFVSDAVYDGRLEPQPENNLQRLILRKNAHKALRPAGICYVPIEHDSCSQRSEEEAGLILDIYKSLRKQSYIDKKGVEHPMTEDNILVVAPYNMQVNLLKRTLPTGARVGTVDKFQGQEAEVVIISMTTSSGDDLPRFIEFLYSKNRLNVAISRARCLTILVANPALMSIRCTTAEQMALVNTLCWVRDYAEKTTSKHDGPSKN